MTIGSILLILAVLLIVILIVARPFLIPQAPLPQVTDRQLLLAEKEALLAQIQALDFDALTEKQDEEAYDYERERLFQAAETVLKRLDESTDVDEAIEAAIMRVKRSVVPAKPAQTDRAAANSLRLCPNCQTAVSSNDNFCASCGQSLSVK